MKKILIIRTLQADLLGALVRKWQEMHPEAEFSILTHRNAQNIEYYEDLFARVFIYDARRDFSLFHIKLSLLRKLRKEKFDLLIFPKKMNRLAGFENVVLLLAALGAENWAHCGIDGVLKPVRKSDVGRAVLAGIGACVFAPVLYLLMLIGLGLAVFSYRKQASSRRITVVDEEEPYFANEGVLDAIIS